MQGKRILLGVTGGIAAYKSADLVRRLIERGAEVQVVMTAAAREFVTATTFQAVSGRSVRSELWDPAAEAAMGHIELARWADVVLIAPASADFLARLATGQADDLLATLCLATAAPIAVAPAMNQQMWANAATQANVALLAERGIHMFGPAAGDQACGESGPGRMLEPADLAERVQALLSGDRRSRRPARADHRGPDARAHRPGALHQQPQLRQDGLRRRTGGTRGRRRGRAGQRAGERSPPRRACARRRGERRADARARCCANSPGTDVFISTAAVADYRPARAAEQKIKKTSETLDLDDGAHHRHPGDGGRAGRAAASWSGFAAETDAVEQNARAKLLTQEPRHDRRQRGRATTRRSTARTTRWSCCGAQCAATSWRARAS